MNRIPRLRILAARGLAAVVLVGGVGCPQVADSDAPPAIQGPAEEVPAPATRVARLTLTQWENAVQDLLRLDAPTGLSAELPKDAYPAGFLFDNPADSLAIDPTQWQGFQRAAADAAALVTADPALLARIAPPDDGSGDLDARARAFIQTIGRRAHRRPLAPADVDAYLAVFRAGVQGFPELPPFAAGARLVLEAMLQSPFFLYRVELSTAQEGELVPLDGFEIASRLSFALWNTIPDDALLDAAEQGRLADVAGIEAEVRRLLDDKRAGGALLHVMGQLLQQDKLDNIAPSREFYPDAPVDLGAIARAEDQRFLLSLFEGDEGITELLASTRTFVNEDTAVLYGVQGVTGPELVEVELDPDTRRGLFTHLAFLAQNSTSVDPDPIHRGVYLASRVACLSLAAPPGNIPPLPPPAPEETNREVVSRHTEAEGSDCALCHARIINPFGWPYERYDAIGRVRETDRGQPIDTTSVVFFGGEEHFVHDATELAEALAASADVHQCFARHFIESALGRPVASTDDPWIARLGETSMAGAGLKDLLTTLVLSRGFLLRAPDAPNGGAP